MLAVLTGDIIFSKQVADATTYLHTLEKVLKHLRTESKYREIYRGDSFQIEIENPALAFYSAMCIKAALKQIKPLDVRIAIGFGEKTHTAKKVSQSNGSAFIRSGELFETLENSLKQNLAIKSDNAILDTEINTYINLALIAMNAWTPGAAEIVYLSLLHPTKSQSELGRLINIKQNTVSERLKRAYFEELQQFDKIFRQKITNEML